MARVKNVKKKILFFVVDGTIVTGDHVIPESARSALSAAMDAGHILFVNTGRPYLHVEPQIKALPMSGFICSLGGHILFQGEDLCHTSFSPEESREIRDAGCDCAMDMLFESEEAVWFDRRCRNEQGAREFAWLKSIGVPGYDDSFREDFAFDKFVCWPGENGDPERFEAMFRDRLTFIHREHSMREVVRRGLSKADGMRVAMERLGIPREDTFAFGDGANDLPMLRMAGTSILMGNAPKELWHEADFVTAPIWEDGLRRGMEHYGLLK